MIRIMLFEEEDHDDNYNKDDDNDDTEEEEEDTALVAKWFPLADGGWKGGFQLPDGDGHDGDGDHCDGGGDDGDDHDGDSNGHDGDNKMVIIFRPELRFAKEVLRPWTLSK